MKKRLDLRALPEWIRATKLREIRLDPKRVKKELKKGETVAACKYRLLVEARKLEREASAKWKAAK